MKTLFAVLLFLLALQVNATLIPRDYTSTGDNLITFDSDTGLEWLDLSETAGMSVAAALAANVGWTLATRVQFSDMFSEVYSSSDFLLGSNN